MKKIVSTLIALFVGVNVYAVDVSEFDLKGIKLGMSEKEVMMKMPCRNPKIVNGWYGGGPDWDGNKYGNMGKAKRIECKKNAELGVEIDAEGFAYWIWFSKIFNVKPSYKKIHLRLLDKYGTPSHTKRFYDRRYWDGKTYCWGICANSTTYSRWKGSNSLYATWTDCHAYGSACNDNLDIYLYDGKRDQKMSDLSERRKKESKKREKDQASNVDF